MKNVKFNVSDDGKTLIITVDLTQRNGLSSTGKTVNIATTAGNVSLDHPYEGIKVGLNVYTKEGVPAQPAAQ